MAAGQVLARYAKPAVGLAAEGEDDRVVKPLEVLDVDVLADLDVAEEAEALAGGGLLVDRITDLILGWSGATPPRTRPNGVGRRSNRSTWAWV